MEEAVEHRHQFSACAPYFGPDLSPVVVALAIEAREFVRAPGVSLLAYWKRVCLRVKSAEHHRGRVFRDLWTATMKRSDERPAGLDWFNSGQRPFRAGRGLAPCRRPASLVRDFDQVFGQLNRTTICEFDKENPRADRATELLRLVVVLDLPHPAY